MSLRGDGPAPADELVTLRARLAELERHSQEQTQKLDQLVRSERHYRSLVEQAQDGFFVADERGIYVGSNASLRELLGYSEQELRGKHIEDLIDPENLVATPLRRRELKQSKRLVTSRVLRRKDGGTVNVEVTASFLDNGHFGAIVRDVSDRLQAERERARLAEELRHAQRMESIGRLAGGIAHDFNNLLLVVSTNAQVLQRRYAERVCPELGAIVAATERGGALTKQLLSWSRAHVRAWTVFDVNQVLQGMQDTLVRLMGDTIGLEFRLAGQECLTLGDPAQLEQVIMNLLVNARDACGGRGNVHVTTGLAASEGRTCVREEGLDGAARFEAFGRDVLIRVQDWGHGMDSETQAHIFEPFFTTKPAGVGTGLGLSMVYNIVAQSGGTIAVTSGRGEGSVFELRFAALRERWPRPVSQPSAQSAAE